MTNVVPLESRRRNPALNVTECCCSPTYVCYPHRIAEAARILRVDLAATEGELMVSRVRFAAAVEAVLPMLDAIVGECLPDERSVQ